MNHILIVPLGSVQRGTQVNIQKSFFQNSEFLIADICEVYVVSLIHIRAGNTLFDVT